MFSGIIEEMGVVKAVTRQPGGVRLVFLAKRILDELEIGESVAVNGACLTVTARQPDSFEADLSPETLQRTTAGQLAVGQMSRDEDVAGVAHDRAAEEVVRLALEADRHGARHRDAADEAPDLRLVGRSGERELELLRCSHRRPSRMPWRFNASRR